MSYIDRDAFLAEQRHLYCENCARHKNGKGKFVYDIGDAPCRACDICDVLDAVEDAPAADVVPWETLMRYANYFCAAVSMPEFVREAKMFYDSTKAAMDGGNIE